MEAKVIVTTELQLKAFIADAISTAFKYHQPTTSDVPEDNPYGDFNWLSGICTGIPTSTLRVKSAAGEIPGVVRFGKRVLYEKVAVLSWLRSKTSPTTDGSKIEQAAELQLATQLGKRSKKGGVAA